MTMGTKLGDARRARELAKLFEAWRRAFEVQDKVAMQRARRAIDATFLEAMPQPANVKEID
jgi:hypothetical protein